MTGRAEPRWSAPLQVRQSGRVLEGDAVRYGVRSRELPERILPGAFTSREEPLVLDVAHDPLLPVATTDDRLTLNDTSRALSVRAELLDTPLGTPGSGPMSMIRRRMLTGLSVSYYPIKERTVAGVVEVAEAHLQGIGLVSRGMYPGTEIRVRQLGDSWLRATIPFDTSLQCECQGPDCAKVEFLAEAFDRVLAGDDEVFAVAGDFSKVLGSRQKGTLLLEKGDNGLEIGLTEASTPAAQEVIGGARATSYYARPLIDNDASESVLESGVRVYREAATNAILIKPTANNAGWNAVDLAEALLPPRPRQGRPLIWL